MDFMAHSAYADVVQLVEQQTKTADLQKPGRPSDENKQGG